MSREISLVSLRHSGRHGVVASSRILCHSLKDSEKKWGGHMSKLGLLLPLVFLEPVDLLVGTGHWAVGTHVLGVPLEASVVNVTFKVNLVEFCSTLQLYRVFTNPMPCHDDPSFP